MAVRLIALDIDGTLLNSRFSVSERNRAAIGEANRRGIEVALVTGRRYDFALPVARQIESPLTMIVNNGALIRTKDGETHLRHLLPRETALRVLAATLPWRGGASVVFDRPQANQIMVEKIDLEDGLRGAYYKYNLEFLGEAQPLESCLSEDEDPIQVMLAGPVQAMREAESALRGVQFNRSELAPFAVGGREGKQVPHPARDAGMRDDHFGAGRIAEGTSGRRSSSSGAKAPDLRGLNVGAKAPTPSAPVLSSAPALSSALAGSGFTEGATPGAVARPSALAGSGLAEIPTPGATGEFSLAVTAYEARDFSMIDILNPRISKGVTLAEWAALRGVRREEILAIGDNHNDEEMLSFAGIPVVMENAVAELKTRGWHVTRSNDEDGVADAIERFALRETME